MGCDNKPDTEEYEPMSDEEMAPFLGRLLDDFRMFGLSPRDEAQLIIHLSLVLSSGFDKKYSVTDRLGVKQQKGFFIRFMRDGIDFALKNKVTNGDGAD
jgi:hypothetical protein